MGDRQTDREINRETDSTRERKEYYNNTRCPKSHYTLNKFLKIKEETEVIYILTSSKDSLLFYLLVLSSHSITLQTICMLHMSASISDKLQPSLDARPLQHLGASLSRPQRRPCGSSSCDRTRVLVAYTYLLI